MSDRCVDEQGRPDFAGFAEALRSEADWCLRKEGAHGDDGTPKSDAASLRALAERVEHVGRHLAYLGAAPAREPAR